MAACEEAIGEDETTRDGAFRTPEWRIRDDQEEHNS